MTVNKIMIEMEEMNIGATKVVFGTVVTRWTQNTWEVGTFNKDRMDIQMAAGKVVHDAISEMTTGK